MRLSLLLLLSASLSLFGEHGSTATFEKTNQAYRESFGKPTDEKLKFTWQKVDEVWQVGFKSSAGQVIVSTKDGAVKKGSLSAGEASVETDRLEGHTESDFGGKKKRRQKLSLQSPAVFKKNDWTATAPEGWIWDDRALTSPGGSHLAVMRERDVAEREVHYVRSSPEDQLQPEHFIKKYPKPGDELRVRVPVVFTQSGEEITVDPAVIENPYTISNLHWRDSKRIWFNLIERGFGRYALLELNVETGQTRVVAEEKDEKFIHVYEKCGWWDLGEGKLLWRSEATGYSHLYLIDEQSGERKPLTEGEWVVRGVESLQGDDVLFRLGGYYEGQDPYYLHYARLNWRTGEMTLLTEGDGTHELRWSPDGSYYVDQYSRVDLPPVHELRRASDAGRVATLAEGALDGMLAKGFQLPERFVTTDRNGRYDIHGVIWKPRDFDPAKKYAVVENIYAGPHGAFVPKRWSTWPGHRGEMMQAGFVVVQIDGLGTNYRGQEFQQFAYKNLKDSGFPDRIKWMKEAAKSRPWMDLSRVGVYGGSAGGQSTLAGLLYHGDFYLAGASDCGCHDNRMDKIWWNEQWMGWPVDDSYAANSNAEHVELLKGDLLLTVGEVDTNVDPSSTMQVVDALIRADKDFEFYNVPNAGHGIGESRYLRRKRVEFFQRSLGGPQ